MVQYIQQWDQEISLDRYLLKALSSFGIQLEEMEKRSFQLDFDLLENTDFPIPLLRESHMHVTLDRETAVQHEDIEFITWDHPMITGAMELILASEKGNSTVAFWKDKNNQDLLLESIFILECVASPKLHVNRFLPSVPIRVVVDQSLKNKSREWPHDKMAGQLKDVPLQFNLGEKGVTELMHTMMNASQKFAEELSKEIILAGKKEMENQISGEINRLKALQKNNPTVRDEEIAYFKDNQNQLEQAIQSARLRLDGLRLILPNE